MNTAQIRSLSLLAVLASITGIVALVGAHGGPEDEIYVPGAAHVFGSNNTVWRTDLEIRSVGTLAASVQIDLLRLNRNNTTHPSTVIDLSTGHARRIEDVLETLFGYEGSATLRITTLAGEVRATSRTYNQTPSGTFGQFIGGTTVHDVFATGNDATLIQLTASAVPDTGSRTNIGLVNLEGQLAQIDIELYLADLSYLGRVAVDLEPYGYRQINNVFSEVTGNEVADGIAIIRAVSSATRYLAYASVIDNQTGDPIYIPAMPNSAAIQTRTPTPTPTDGTPTTPTPTATPDTTPTATPTPVAAVEVTTLDEETYSLIPSSIRFRVGNGIQTSLVLCSRDGTLGQVTSSNFSFIRGPTETVEWVNCCANFGAKLEYETFIGLGGEAVARSTCTAGTPFFAISGTEVDTGSSIEVNGVDLDIAVWP